jgi:hypothetical protein
MLARWKTLDNQNSSLTIDLLEDEGLDDREVKMEAAWASETLVY